MTKIVTSFSLLLLSLPLQAQTVKLPERVTAGVGRLAAIKVEYDGDDVRWTVPPALDAFREYDPDPKVVRLRVIGYMAGAYELKAITCKDKKLSDFAVCVVVIGDGPTPPVPPIPPVPPVPPPDALTLKIVEAMRFETDGNKDDLRQIMAKFYRASAVLADDLAITTWGALFAAMGRSAEVYGIKGKLPKVQAVLGAFLSTELPTDPARALAGERDKAKSSFLKVAAALDAAKE